MPREFETQEQWNAVVDPLVVIQVKVQTERCADGNRVETPDQVRRSGRIMAPPWSLDPEGIWSPPLPLNPLAELELGSTVAGGQLRSAEMDTTPKFQWIARAGYSARAAVFFLVGGLALFSGIAGGKSDTKSALDALMEQPFGKIWVGLVAVGLMGFVMWRLTQSLANADNQKHDAKGVAIRSALLGSAIAYAGLAYYAADHALGFASQENNGGERGVAGWLMAQAFGRYLAGAVGVAFIVGGLVTIAKGMLRKYERYLDPQARESRVIRAVSIYGLGARGLLFAIVGGFFVYAALEVAPGQAGGLGDALNWIRALPFGGPLYSIVAVGLLSFGAYNLVQARYRIIRIPEISTASQETAQISSRIVGFGQ